MYKAAIGYQTRLDSARVSYQLVEWEETLNIMSRTAFEVLRKRRRDSKRGIKIWNDEIFLNDE